MEHSRSFGHIGSAVYFMCLFYVKHNYYNLFYDRLKTYFIDGQLYLYRKTKCELVITSLSDFSWLLWFYRVNLICCICLCHADLLYVLGTGTVK